jgi:hypothetical protein
MSCVKYGRKNIISISANQMQSNLKKLQLNLSKAEEPARNTFQSLTREPIGNNVIHEL